MPDEMGKVVIIEQGSAEAQKIAKALSSPTAADLFNTLSDCPMSAAALSERIGITTPTVKYHLENLMAAGLIEVINTRWSEKGREMKIYAACNKVVVLTPRKHTDMREIAERYGILAGCIAVGCSLILAIPRTFGQFTPDSDTPLVGAPIGAGFDMMSTLHVFIQIFFVGAMVLLVLMMGYEMYKVRKEKIR